MSMSAMFRRNGTSFTPRKVIPLRGLFIDGKWHCDCDPRLPAEHFQTKNGGKNHGRWFFTCQKPQHKRCKFFLWDDDAKLRAQAVVLENVRSEPDLASPSSRTPAVPTSATGLPTPNSGLKRRRDSLGDSQVLETPSKKSRTIARPRDGLWETGVKGVERNRDNGGKDGDSFGWDDTLDEEVVEILSSQDLPRPLFNLSTPRKEMKPGKPGSPGNRKRKFTHVGHEHDVSGAKETESSNIESRHSQSPTTEQFDDSSFSSHLSTQQTANSSSFPIDDRFIVPPSTPTPVRFASTPLINQRATDTQPYCQLVSQTLTLLASYHIVLPPDVKQDLITLLDTYDLRTQGIARGRDISRLAIKKREERIQALVGRIEVLEAEREGWRVARLKQDGNRGKTRTDSFENTM